MEKIYRNPSPPNETFDLESNCYTFFKPQNTIIPTKLDFLHLIDKKFLTTPPASDHEEGEVSEEEKKMEDVEMKEQSKVEEGMISDESETSSKSKLSEKKEKKKKKKEKKRHNEFAKEALSVHMEAMSIKERKIQEQRQRKKAIEEIKRHLSVKSKSSDVYERYRSRRSPEGTHQRRVSPEDIRHRSSSSEDARSRSSSSDNAHYRHRSTENSYHRRRSPEDLRRKLRSPADSRSRHRSPEESRRKRRSPVDLRRRRLSPGDSRHRRHSPEDSRRRRHSPDDSRHTRHNSVELRRRRYSPEETRQRHTRSKSPEETNRRCISPIVNTKKYSKTLIEEIRVNRNSSENQSNSRNRGEPRPLINYSDTESDDNIPNEKQPLKIQEKSSKIVIKPTLSIKAETIPEDSSLKLNKQPPPPQSTTPTTNNNNSQAKQTSPITLPEESRQIVSYEDLIENKSYEQTTPKVEVKREKYEPIDSKDDVYTACALNAYYCKVCQLALNSELTWESHIRGKKHGKALKSQAIHEIAKGSIAVPVNPPLSQDAPRFAFPPVGRRRIPLNETSRIQRTVDEHRVNPMPGLDHVLEVRLDSETTYYCELCDAPCGPSSILPHLIGYKHQLRCVKDIAPDYYERAKDRSKRSVEQALVNILFGHESRYGKGRIRVVEDILDSRSRPLPLLPLDPRNQPGPSHRSDSVVKNETSDVPPVMDPCLDTRKGDFFCKVCDSHMNNVNMWEAHIRGKRHLKNIKKIPGENRCKSKTVKAFNLVSKLEKRLDTKVDNYDFIVGLDFIKETQGPHGEFYNCFLCGSCSTNIDIVDHLLQVKHMARYLEKLQADGLQNAIVTINAMDMSDLYFREKLVIDECQRMENLYGRGHVEVYLTKSLLGEAVSINMTSDVEQVPLDNSLDLQASYSTSQPPHITS